MFIIYIITNEVNGKKYVGKTTASLAKRWTQHKSVSGCKAVSAAIVKYGEESFSIEEIDAACSEKELNKREISWIKKLNTISPNGYNLTEGGEGAKHSKQTRGLLSKKLKGRIITKEHRQKISNTMTGRKMPEEQRLNMVGKKLTKKHKENISAGGKGRKVSEETRKKISSSMTGRKRTPLTTEHKQKISDALTGYRRPPFTEKHKANIRKGRLEYLKSNLGKPNV